MISNGRRLLNAVNDSSYRWRRNGHQRRYSVTDLHGVEYTAAMNSGIPAQFYTSVSFDFDRFIHWWLKIIIKPYQLKDAIKEGGAVEGFAGWNGSTNYDGSGLSYGGHNLSADNLRIILKYSKQRGLLPSGVISQLYSESFWGNSEVGRQDNNWSGMTGTAGTRPSGVTVTTGMSRPSGEGGNYMHYANVDDFLNDYTYLLASQTAGNNQKMYNVQGKTTFPDFVIGLFRVGGALYDYASAGYNAYLALMNGVRSGINDSNGGILDQLDDQLLNGKSDGGAEVNPEKPDDNDNKKKVAEKVNSVLNEIDSLKGQTIGSGQCYGLAAFYSQRLEGPGLGGGVTSITDLLHGGMAASDIGTDYNWAKHGWSVVVPTSVEQLVPGAMVTIKAYVGGSFGTGEYGHVAIIKSIDKDNDRISVYQQNDRGREYVTEDGYSAKEYLSAANHVILPPELADGAVAGVVDGGLSYNKVINFPADIKVYIDGIDFTPMFKAQYNGKWIDSYAIFPNDKPSDGYDVMLAASGLNEEQLKKVFSAGEHLVEVSGSMAADVTLRTYLKYNHLN